MQWKILATSFAVVFVAELGDKTQLAAFALAGESRRPVEVIVGASSALVLVTVLGVIAGTWLSKWVPQRGMAIGSALLFIAVGVFLLIRTLKPPADDGGGAEASATETAVEERPSKPG